EDAPVADDLQRRLDLDAAGTPGRKADPVGDVGGTNPGGPDHGAAVDALAAPELDARGGHARHRCAQPHLHAERLEIAPCARTQPPPEAPPPAATAFP